MFILTVVEPMSMGPVSTQVYDEGDEASMLALRTRLLNLIRDFEVGVIESSGVQLIELDPAALHAELLEHLMDMAFEKDSDLYFAVHKRDESLVVLSRRIPVTGDL